MINYNDPGQTPLLCFSLDLKLPSTARGAWILSEIQTSGMHQLVVCLAFSRLETPLYLVHVSIGATSNPLDELKVLLRVPPLDFSTRPGKYIHGGSFASSGSNLLESVCGSWIQSEHRDSVDPSASSIGWNRLTQI